MPYAISIHALAAVIWVGGMFFAYVALRPASGSLDPAVRLPLWVGTLQRFFLWVWISLIALLGTGYWMASGYFGGMANLSMNVNIMQALAWVMILLFLHARFAPYRRLKKLTEAGDYAGAAKQLNQIRILVGINLILGLIVVVVASGGQYVG